VRRGGLWAKHQGFKQGAIGNTLWEHIGNLLGTKKKEKILLSLPPSSLTRTITSKKITRHFECRLNLPLGCMKLQFPKLFVTIFSLH
jgi:hypothetical protein